MSQTSQPGSVLLSADQRFMNRARGGDDQVAVKQADAAIAAILAPQFGRNRLADQSEQGIGPLSLGDDLFLLLLVAAEKAAAGSAAATSTAPTRAAATDRVGAVVGAEL